MGILRVDRECEFMKDWEDNLKKLLAEGHWRITGSEILQFYTIWYRNYGFIDDSMFLPADRYNLKENCFA